MTEEFVSALQRELSAPSRGETIHRIMDRLSFAKLLGPMIGSAIQKLELTRADREIHSFSAMLPSNPLPYIFACIIYPTSLRDGSRTARDDFFRNPLGDAPQVCGVLQMTIFAGDHPLSLTFAWRPSLKAEVSDPILESVVIPWRLETEKEIAHDIPPDGAAIISMAEATKQLTDAMQALFLVWPNEERPIQRLGLPEARKQLTGAIEKFNAAARRCRLAHRMPFSVYDETWLPHNLENARQFSSVTATVRAELGRTLGIAASRLFQLALGLSLGEMSTADRARLANDYDKAASVAEPDLEPANPASEVDVFICYSWADKTRGARDVFEFVKRQGLTAWFDEEQRPQTASLENDIAVAISGARIVIVCFSQEMVTGGGYVLRELLFALSVAPQRLIVARLDNSPVPSTVGDVATVDWFQRGGAEQLLDFLTRREELPHAEHLTSLHVTSARISNDLLSLVLPLQRQGGRFGTTNRDRLVACRATLMTSTLQIYERRESSDWAGAEQIAEAVRADGCWLPLNDPSLRSDPTMTLPLIRLRRGLFETKIDISAQNDWAVHNRAAFELLEELLALDLDALRPAPELGWLVSDSMVVVRDCLDAFAVAEEWFRGWSPEMLADLCSVPRESAMTAADRITRKTAELADRMLALRLLEDVGQSVGATGSWSDVWSSFRQSMLGKLHAEEQSPAAIYFHALSAIFDDDLVAAAAVRLADGVFEAIWGEGNSREEAIETKHSMRIRFVFRAYRTASSRLASFNLVRGTIEPDLTAHVGDSDITILLIAFVVPDKDEDCWKYDVFFNVLPHPRVAPVADAIALRTPFLMSQMLTDGELARVAKGSLRTIYEDL